MQISQKNEKEETTRLQYILYKSNCNVNVSFSASVWTTFLVDCILKTNCQAADILKQNLSEHHKPCLITAVFLNLIFSGSASYEAGLSFGAQVNYTSEVVLKLIHENFRNITRNTKKGQQGVIDGEENLMIFQGQTTSSFRKEYARRHLQRVLFLIHNFNNQSLLC